MAGPQPPTHGVLQATDGTKLEFVFNPTDLTVTKASQWKTTPARNAKLDRAAQRDLPVQAAGVAQSPNACANRLAGDSRYTIAIRPSWQAWSNELWRPRGYGKWS